MQEDSNKKLIWASLIIIVALGLMIWGALVEQDNFSSWEDTEVACLIGGHTGITTQARAHLDIFIDGEKQSIPSGIGINTDCMAEVHTHDGSGDIYIETAGDNLDITLADFFSVWDQSFNNPDYERTVLVNRGETDGSTYEFSDGDMIEIRFTSIGTSSRATSSPAQPTTTTE